MTRIYIIKYKNALSFSPAFPPERESEIQNTGNDALRLSRRMSWQALCVGLRHSLGLSPEECVFSKSPEGKWLCDRADISLSHSGEYACAAVSDGAVGVDIEQPSVRNLSTERINALAEHITAESEKHRYTEKEFYRLWTKKESIFKMSGGKVFSPHEIEVSLFDTVTAECPEFTVSVCISRPGMIEFYVIDSDEIRPAEVVTE